MRLIFMGTPETAVPTLQRCIEDGHQVVAVWTQPDRPAGRGNRPAAPPVKMFALAHGIAVHQLSKIRTEEARDLFASHDADAAVVVAYGRILPAAFLHIPRRGCLNVHFSLLPKYRGAAPVNWAIARGERQTGVTTMQMDEGLDTGPIFLQRATSIEETETAPDLLERLALMGADLLSETVKHLDDITPRIQRAEEATFAPLLRREDGLINWSRTAQEIERRVRGFQPWPSAYTAHKSRRLIVWRAEASRLVEGGGERSGGTRPAGEIVAADAEGFVVACGEGTALRLLEVQLEGKRRMDARAFINGLQVRVGETLG